MRLLMCRPTHYRIAYEINPWMSLRRQADHARALRQWQALYALLTRQLAVRVVLMPPHRGVPDLTFTANAGLVSGRCFLLSRFRYRQRQREEPYVERYARAAGYEVVRLPARYTFEGEGDALWAGGTLVFGFRFRSDAPAHEALAQRLAAPVLPVELADRRFYHLDTCFCPLPGGGALWFPGAFDRYGRKVLEGLCDPLISASEADAKRFACNAIVVGGAIVMQAGCSRALARRLERARLRLWPVDLSEFLKAGGSAKCLALWLRRPDGSQAMAG